MTTKMIKLSIPTIGDLEFAEDDEFIADIKELDALRGVVEYDAEFWGGEDCE